MFETISMDLHGKLGLIDLPKKKVRTPTLLPVLDPKENIIPAKEMEKKFGFSFIITSAYLFLKRYGMPNDKQKIHDLLDFSGNIMMDSGAYQTLAYGDVNINPIQTLQIQSKLETDVGVILDVPTPPKDTYQKAKKKIEETIKNIEMSIDFIQKCENVIWTLPIQGGKNVQLIEDYIRLVRKKNLMQYFGFYALGSVVPIMNQYDYLTLFSMIKTTRKHLPQNVPFHLFGAGHPMIFPYIVALGCDTFDSAAYILYAKENRYMTTTATHQLSDLIEFPCSCEVCNKWQPKELLNADNRTRTRNIALHNLAVSKAEINNIQSAIKEGRLWELLEQRSKAHPLLFKAFNHFLKDSSEDYLEFGTPITKQTGIKLYDQISFYRPELTRARRKILSCYTQNNRNLSLLVSSGKRNPLETLILHPSLQRYFEENRQISDFVFFLPFLGAIPIELVETFPFSQYVFSGIISSELIAKSMNELAKLVEKTEYKNIEIILIDTNDIPEQLIIQLEKMLSQHQKSFELKDLRQLSVKKIEK
ncbi:MAG: tRNA guanosine(15) transglycosylase TgtA [Candidatus Heimdallarchaeaceae archaeon]